MLLVVEIGLTVWACLRFSQAKKSWAFGLLPILIGFVCSFCAGFFLGAIGVAASTILTFGILLDLAMVVVLIVLIVKNKPVK